MYARPTKLNTCMNVYVVKTPWSPKNPMNQWAWFTGTNGQATQHENSLEHSSHCILGLPRFYRGQAYTLPAFLVS